MLMLEQRIQQQFFEGADLLSQTADPLSRPIAQAAQALVGCITAGGKVLIVGTALARYAATLLVGRFERDRPPLAAMALGTAGEPALAQLQALGAPGDVLVAVGAAADAVAALVPCVRAAKDKDMIVVALTGLDAAGLDKLLVETDVHIAVPHERAARVQEVQLLTLHCLADAVDLQLMGEQESS